MEDKIQLQIIGKVSSAFQKIEDCPLQENEGGIKTSIIIKSDFFDGLKDLKIKDEILLLTWLHKANREILTCHKRKSMNTGKVGVFSTRSPNRPNPIGVHRVKIIDINENILKVYPLEVLDETPVLDIKPVI